MYLPSSTTVGGLPLQFNLFHHRPYQPNYLALLRHLINQIIQLSLVRYSSSIQLGRDIQPRPNQRDASIWLYPNLVESSY